MNRATRDRFVSGTNQRDLTSGNACWETPPAVFGKLNADFGPFDIDLTADRRRALCPVWFGPQSPVRQYDALSARWRKYGRRGYANPPYGDFVQHFLARAAFWCRYHGFASTLLLPLRVTKAFRELVVRQASHLFFCDSRITFWENGAPRLNPDTGKPDGAIFDSVVVRFVPGPPRPLVVDEWAVPAHLKAVAA